MNYCIIENGIITNIIVADSEFANSIGALPFYEGVGIGDRYYTEQERTILSLQLAIAELTAVGEQQNLENKLAIAELSEALLGGKS